MQDMAEPGNREEYEFAVIAQQLIKVLLKTAEDHVDEAQNMLANTKALTEEIETQIREHAAMLDSMNSRMKLFGEDILFAHRKYIDGGK